LLQELLQRPGFKESCEKWRQRERKHGIYTDIYDGKIWEEFQTYHGSGFLSKPFTYGLMMNVDWFKLYKHTEYSVGAIYLSIMNLPREIRFKPENILLVGLIPGPCEPKHDINPFLTPLVEELLELFSGVQMKIYPSSEVHTVRCALLGVASDIPACRKASGFLGHSATLGCSRCFKQFPGSVGNKDYSGFDRSSWTPRSVSKHRADAEIILHCTQKTRRAQLESEKGCRYSVLLKLPYFDPIRMSIIDPMHNLYLGTAKRIINYIWLETGLLTKKDLSVVQDRVNSVCVPPTVGRIPLKIASSFAGFTANQFQNWTNIFSLMVLHDLLPTDDFECWRHFVLASRLLTQMHLSLNDIQLADALLLQFCRRIERMYGRSVVTPNMHMHCHLKQCLLDYGPVYSFWLYSFERYNGILESYPTNNWSIEIQFMRKFTNEFRVYAIFQPQQFEEDFHDINSILSAPVLQGSLLKTLQPKVSECMDPHQIKDWTFDSVKMQFSKSYVRCSFSPHQLTEINSLYSRLYPDIEIATVNNIFKKYSNVHYRGVSYKAMVNTTDHILSIALAQYPESPVATVRPVLLRYFMQHSFHSQCDKVYVHALVAVSWLKEHHAKQSYGKPLELWWRDLYESNSVTFLPMQYLAGHCAYTDVKFEAQTVVLVCPVQ
jgi:hypothetical protein